MNANASNSEGIYQKLRSHRFLQGFDDSNVQQLASVGRVVSWPEGTIVFNAGDPAEHCYLVIDGLVVLEICDSVAGCSQVQTVGRGELLGWSAIHANAEMSSTARTVQATQAIEFSGLELQQLFERQPSFGFQFMSAVARTLSKRLTATRLQLIDVYRRDSPRSRP